MVDNLLIEILKGTLEKKLIVIGKIDRTTVSYVTGKFVKNVKKNTA